MIIRLDEEWSTYKKLLFFQAMGGGALSEYEVTGNPAVFNTNVAKPLSAFTIPFLPVQNLNGQSAPYPPGGGKNKFYFDPSGDRPSTQPTVTRVYSDGYIELSGTSTGENQNIYSIDVTDIVQTLGTAYFTVGIVKQTANVSARVNVQEGSTVISRNTFLTDNTVSPVELTYVEGYTYLLLIHVKSTGTVSGKFGIQISETQADYAPYSNICPISGWTGVTAYRTGINVWDEQWEVGAYNTSTGEKTGTSAGRIRSVGFIPVIPGGNYKVVGDIDGVLYYDKSKNYLSYSTNNSVITIPDDCYFITFYSKTNYGSTYNHDLSLNYPSTETEYHPYTGASYPVTFGQTVYGGTWDAVNGVLMVELAYDQMTYSYLSGLSSSYIGYGQQTWDGATRNVVWVRNWNYQTAKARQSGGIEAYCNAFKVSMHDTGFVGSQNRVYFDVGSMASVEDFLSAVQALETNGGGLFIAYELATPYEIQLDPLSIQTLIGDNTIWTDTNGENTVKYLKKG